MDLNMTEIVIAIVGVVLPFGIGFIVAKWSSFRSAAMQSENKFDDKLVAAIESLAQKIVDEKSKPTTTDPE